MKNPFPKIGALILWLILDLIIAIGILVLLFVGKIKEKLS
jgi:hypothetical protein